MYFPPHTQMLRTVPKLNRVTLRQAVMMPLYLSTTILSHIFITLITLFFAGRIPGGAQGRTRTGTPKQLILNQPSLPIPSLGQISI